MSDTLVGIFCLLLVWIAVWAFISWVLDVFSWLEWPVEVAGLLALAGMVVLVVLALVMLTIVGVTAITGGLS